jgi:hypothetical protein
MPEPPAHSQDKENPRDEPKSESRRKTRERARTEFLEIIERPVHCKENPIYVFLFWELHGLSPNFFHIHVSVNDLYILRIDPHISLQQNRQTDLEIYKSLTDI